MTTPEATLVKNKATASEPRARRLWQDVAPFGLVFLFSSFIFFFQLGSYPLFNPDEALYAEPAREMLVTGEWITTLLNYVVRYTKPPLVIWAMAGSMNVFGMNEFASRAPVAASAALLVAITYCFLARFVGVRAALIAAGILATSPLYVGIAREAITDMPLSLFLAGGLLSFLRFSLLKENFYKWAGYVLIGLAVMTKGPVAVVLPVAILALFHLLKGDWKTALREYQPIVGAAIIGAIALPWFMLEIAITKGEYFYAFIVRENFTRFTGVVDSHAGAWWYHLAAMFGGFFPWSLFLVGAAARAIDARRHIKNSVLAQIMFFCVVSALVILGFFSVSTSKLLPYTLPAFPMLAILAAIELDKSIEEKTWRRLAIPFALLAIVFGAALQIVPGAISHLRNAPPELLTLLKPLLAFECILALVALVLCRLRRCQAAVALFIIMFAEAQMHFGPRLLSTFSNHWEAPLVSYCQYAGNTDYPVLIFDLRAPGAPFYVKRQVINATSKTELEDHLNATSRAYVISKVRDMKYLSALPGCKVIARDKLYVFVSYIRTAKS